MIVFFYKIYICCMVCIGSIPRELGNLSLLTSWGLGSNQWGGIWIDNDKLFINDFLLLR